MNGGFGINIILYSNNCPKCKILKQKLDQKQVVYEKCNDMDIMMEKSFLSMPILQVDGKIMNFNEAIKYVKEI